MGVHSGFLVLVLLALVWLGSKYLLPFAIPFLLGTALAVAAEPVVSLGVRKLECRRGLASGIGVTLTLFFLGGIVIFLGALTVRELGLLADRIPGMVQQSANTLESFLSDLSQKAPDPVGPMLTNSVHRFFQDGAAITDRAVQQVPGLLSGVLGKVPGSAMCLGTGVISGYFISARLPKLKTWIGNRLPKSYYEKVLPVLRKIRRALGKWLVAQGKLMSITYLIVTAGLLLIGIPHAFGWALLVAAVDAVPLLGTGTVLLPWSVTKFLQGESFAAVGLLILYLVAVVTRTVLEPRFFGKHLGLDPLVMLIFLYVGYRLWGFWGIIVSPMLAAAGKAAFESVNHP